MFHTHVSSVCSKYFICFRSMLHPSVSFFRCRVMGTAREPGDGARRVGVGGWGMLGASDQGAWRTWGRSNGARSSRRPHLDSWVLLMRREEGFRGKERGGGGGRGKEARRSNSWRERRGVDVSPPIACHGGTRGSLFGFSVCRTRFILVRTLDRIE